MSIPPQTIRIKRKREEEAPVTFLQFDEGAKRHRTGSNWVYQRRDAASSSSPPQPNPSPSRPSTTNNVKPTIHVSKPSSSSSSERHHQQSSAAKHNGGLSPRKTLSPRPSLQRLKAGAAEPRRFHLSKKMMKTMMAQGAHSNNAAHTGINKKSRSGPAVFVERIKKQKVREALEGQAAAARAKGDIAGEQQQQSRRAEEAADENGVDADEGGHHAVQQLDTPRKLKKPGTTRAKSAKPDDAPTRRAAAPLPASAANPHSEDMDKIAADMNQWVLNEIGANLEEMEQEKRRETRTSPLRFKPKPPAQRYFERNHAAAGAQQVLTPDTSADTTMTDMSEDEDDDGDWVIEEYIRIPASAMAVDLSPTEVGVLVLDGEEDDMLFFGPENDGEDDYLEDDEDENAENHYTADYPEDEVDSDDEYGRQAYCYRNYNASDDEEYDKDLYSDHESDEMIMEGDDDDLTMARIKAYVRRSNNNNNNQSGMGGMGMNPGSRKRFGEEDDFP